jgi:hypothetical protein
MGTLRHFCCEGGLINAGNEKAEENRKSLIEIPPSPLKDVQSNPRKCGPRKCRIRLSAASGLAPDELYLRGFDCTQISGFPTMTHSVQQQQQRIIRKKSEPENAWAIGTKFEIKKEVFEGRTSYIHVQASNFLFYNSSLLFYFPNFNSCGNIL